MDAVRRYSELVSNLDSFVSLDSPQHLMTSPVLEFTSQSSAIDAEVLRVRGKLERALERLRRAALRVLEATQHQNKDSRQVALSLLEVIATTLEGSLTQVKSLSTSSRHLTCKPSFRTELSSGDVPKRRAH